MRSLVVANGVIVYVIVSVTDGFDTTTSISSTLTVSNTPPEAPVVTIDPSDPVSGEDLFCEVTSESFDADGDTVTLGRHPESDIFLDDITVSRRHAEVRRDGARYRVRDVGSLNGTYINRDRIDEQELHEGDELQVGKFKLLFVFGTGEI